jgi:signal transduction histidine kinase
MKTLTSRLLVVDTDGEFLQDLRESLTRDFSIETAESSDQATERLQAEVFDIVLANTKVIRADGYNLFEWVRLHHPLTIPVILTPLTSGEAALAALRESAFDYLTKPIDPSQFALCIQRAMEYRRSVLSERSLYQDVERQNKQFGDRVRTATRELISSNEHLSAANRAKDEFLAAMSHELRTPLTAITGAVRILQSPRLDDEKGRSILDVLDRNVGTLKRLLDDLLDCSRIAAGKLGLDLSPTSLNECVAAAVETMRSKAAEAKVELHALFPIRPVIVQGSPIRLQQIAWNLIDNAIKFTGPGGHVAVSVSEAGEWVDLIVCDSGTGLSEEHLKRIFEPFAQVRESDAQKKGGLGLGLALVRNLTEMHDGSVRVESDGIGKGSRFIVRLPAAKVAPLHTAA